MERLTHKGNERYWINYFKYTDEDVSQKLGVLEDIEQELGIPLEVLFKALKEGIYVEFVSDEIRKCEVRFRKGFNTFVFEAVSLEKEKDGNRYEDIIVAKDYGFNWALTKEELQ